MLKMYKKENLENGEKGKTWEINKTSKLRNGQKGNP
jgi:hypothetical protein